MKLPSKRSILRGSVALLLGLAIALTGIKMPRLSPGASFDYRNWLHGALPFDNTVHAQGKQATAAPQMSEQAFKNITVLKGIPVDEFMGTMGLFSAALSVCCGDCHTGAGTSDPKWEADPPRKQVARRMVEMVNKINQDSFNGRQVVTCWTCHRGAQSPANT